MSNDKTLYATWNCPKVVKNINDRMNEPEVVALQKKHEKFFKDCADAAGITWKLDVFTFPQVSFSQNLLFSCFFFSFFQSFSI